MRASTVLEVVLRGSEKVAEATLAFRFERPRGFDFKAGQAVQLSLENGEQRLFSLASAPFEDHLLVATRMRADSAFKSALAALPPGTKVRLEGPTGDFTLHEDARPAPALATEDREAGGEAVQEVLPADGADLTGTERAGQRERTEEVVDEPGVVPGGAEQM